VHRTDDGSSPRRSVGQVPGHNSGRCPVELLSNGEVVLLVDCTPIHRIANDRPRPHSNDAHALYELLMLEPRSNLSPWLMVGVCRILHCKPVAEDDHDQLKMAAGWKGVFVLRQRHYQLVLEGRSRETRVQVFEEHRSRLGLCDDILDGQTDEDRIVVVRQIAARRWFSGLSMSNHNMDLGCSTSLLMNELWTA